MLFLKIFRLEKFEGAEFTHDNGVLKFQPKKTHIKHFAPEFRHFCLCLDIFRLKKFEAAAFKYGNSFSKSLPKNAEI